MADYESVVTLLFTDIEGSTRLWEEHPEEMRRVLRQHDDLLRACIESHGGRVFKTIGDAFCAAFLEPALAVRAALAAQEWLPPLTLATDSTPLSLRVRMALHTGPAEVRDADYFGPTVNRVARLLALAHGGQILLSGGIQSHVQGCLPPDTGLRDLGSHRLRDLQRPEQVYQLLNPGLPSQFPPVLSLDTLPNNLPLQLTSFVGRERELAEVKRLLRSSRLLTLTGAGGTGKTRLALQAAADLLLGDGDGVWMIDLASLSDPELVAQSVGTALGVQEEPGRPPRQTLIDYLKPRRLLLILDNCEHVLGASAALAEQVLRFCAGVGILTTSRERLGIPGERTYRVPSLGHPDPRSLPSIEEVLRFEAVRLFVDRAVQSQPAFVVTELNVADLAQICSRLDGIPLAIELAAARVRALPLAKLAERLDDRFRLLTGGSRTALPRQQTLRALIDWSYDLLAAPERLLLQRLSVFAGGWTLEAAEAVCGGEPLEEWEVMDLLTALVDKSLVVFEEARGRYRLLETIRQYARERPEGAAASGGLRDCHRDYYLRLAEQAGPKWEGPDALPWLDLLEADRDNLRAALEWAAGDTRILRLASALWRFWYVRGYVTEGASWLERALAVESGPGCEARASALTGLGTMAYCQADFAAATRWHTEALALYRELGDRNGAAFALNNIAVQWTMQGARCDPEPLLRESVALHREVGDLAGASRALNNLGNLRQMQGDLIGAEATYRESLALARQLGEDALAGNNLSGLAELARHHRDHAAAKALNRECLDIWRARGARDGASLVLANLGAMAVEEEDFKGARDLFRESLRLGSEASSPRCLLLGLLGVAGLLGGVGKAAFGARVLGTVAAACDALDYHLEPPDAAYRDRTVVALGSALGDDTCSAEIESGRRRPLDQVVAEVLVALDA